MDYCSRLTLYGYQGGDKLIAVGDGALSNARKLTTTTAIGVSAGANLDAEIAPNGKQVLWTGTQNGTYVQNGTKLTFLKRSSSLLFEYQIGAC